VTDDLFKPALIYQDDRLLVLDKPSGMIVHRGLDRDPICLADIARDYYARRPVYAVHRLDRGTSGLVVFALDADCARYMQQILQGPKVQKTYLALVRGHFAAPITLDHPVRQKRRYHQITNTLEKLQAVTVFAPLAHAPADGQRRAISLIQARPLTGRMHQIRMHLKHLSHPIIGDVRYGKGEINKYFREHHAFQRLALHAHGLQFDHPAGHTISLYAAPSGQLESLLKELSMWPHGDKGAKID
jgi:tRNA pseudouridine65 synthase